MGGKLTFVDDFLEKNLNGSRIHLVGAKGTGMAALAEIFSSWGVILTGADVAESFQTQNILDRIGLEASVGFSAGNLPKEIDLIIYSAAYVPETNPQLKEGKKRGIPIMSYPAALGRLSLVSESIAIAGVHGKSTTAAMCSTIISELDLPATVLTGTGIINLDNSSVVIRGNKFFVAETCEYRNHFSEFKADHVVVTNVEFEHVDSFATRKDIIKAFIKFICGISKHGKVIYCADDFGAVEVVNKAATLRSDIKLIPYGETAHGRLNVSNVQVSESQTSFQINCFENQLFLSVPGKHNVLNATAAVGIVTEIMLDSRCFQPDSSVPVITKALKHYKGGKRRTELIGEVEGILFIDDYAHHPTAISSTLGGISDYYPERRIVVDFMSHTFSRTKAFKEEFGAAFSLADELLLHPVYGSARELNQVINSFDDMAESIGRMLFEHVKNKHTKVSYYSSFLEAANYLSGTLSSGDLLITMGAGDNWKVGVETMKLIKAGS